MQATQQLTPNISSPADKDMQWQTARACLVSLSRQPTAVAAVAEGGVVLAALGGQVAGADVPGARQAARAAVDVVQPGHPGVRLAGNCKHRAQHLTAVRGSTSLAISSQPCCCDSEHTAWNPVRPVHSLAALALASVHPRGLYQFTMCIIAVAAFWWKEHRVQ
jgi:hypothetical protein